MSNWQHKKHPSLVLGSTVEGDSTVTLTGGDFERHTWVQGISGSGKSTFLAWVAVSLLRQGFAFTLIDPHGDLVRLILSLLASTDFFHSQRNFERLYFVDFARTDSAIPFNVLNQEHLDHYKVASNILEAIHRAFPTASGTTAALDNTITYASFVLAENGVPITQLQRFLLDRHYRDTLLVKINDPQIVQFFDFKFSDKVSTQLIDSTMRRLDLLTFSPTLRRSLGQKATLNFRQLMDNNISCLISLGGLTDTEKRLLGCLLMVNIEQAFLSRATASPQHRLRHFVIVDEFPLFSASGESFSVILEQVRKYAGSLVLANQTYSQLSKDLVGSLQNAIPIMMKSGTDDSSALVSRFYRPQQEQRGFLDLLGFRDRIPSAFARVKNTQEAKLVFETLRRQEAIVMVKDVPVKIMTPTLPVTIDQQKVDKIETIYARRLLTPLSQIERERTSAHLVVVTSNSAPHMPLAQRRVPGSLAADREPFQLTTGDLSTDILAVLYHFHYVTLGQLCKLLERESSVNYVRTKVKSLVSDGQVETTTLARSSAGKPPTVFYLSAKGLKEIAGTLGLPVTLPTGAKKHGYVEHTLACNEPLLASVLLSRIEPSITLYDLKHERTLKNAPVKVSEGVYVVPDGFVHLGLKNEAIGLIYEIDRNTEDREKIRAKIQNYKAFASGIYQQTFGIESLTIAFCVTDGGEKRVKQLVTWTEQALENNKHVASLFLLGAVTPGSLVPARFFLQPFFVSPFDTTPHALIENVP